MTVIIVAVVVIILVLLIYITTVYLSSIDVYPFESIPAPIDTTSKYYKIEAGTYVTNTLKSFTVDEKGNTNILSLTDKEKEAVKIKPGVYVTKKPLYISVRENGDVRKYISTIIDENIIKAPPLDLFNKPGKIETPINSTSVYYSIKKGVYKIPSGIHFSIDENGVYEQVPAGTKMFDGEPAYELQPDIIYVTPIKHYIGVTHDNIEYYTDKFMDPNFIPVGPPPPTPTVPDAVIPSQDNPSNTSGTGSINVFSINPIPHLLPTDSLMSLGFSINIKDFPIKPPAGTSKYYLQFADLYLYMDDKLIKPEDKLFTVKAEKGYDDSKIDNAFDDNPDTYYSMYSKQATFNLSFYFTKPLNLTKIRIRARKDCCPEYLTHATVSVYNTSYRQIYYFTLESVGADAYYVLKPRA